MPRNNIIKKIALTSAICILPFIQGNASKIFNDDQQELITALHGGCSKRVEELVNQARETYNAYSNIENQLHKHISDYQKRIKNRKNIILYNFRNALEFHGNNLEDPAIDPISKLDICLKKIRYSTLKTLYLLKKAEAEGLLTFQAEEMRLRNMKDSAYQTYLSHYTSTEGPSKLRTDYFYLISNIKMFYLFTGYGDTITTPHPYSKCRGLEKGKILASINSIKENPVTSKEDLLWASRLQYTFEKLLP